MTEPLIETRPWEMDRPTREDFVRAFCELQAAVTRRIDPEASMPSDCFCGHTTLSEFRNKGLALKAIVEAVEQTIFEKGRDEHSPASQFHPSREPRRFWVGRHGAVVSNKPTGRWKLGPFMDEEVASAAAVKIALDAASDWFYYGGFLVCESCSRRDAQRIVAALNFAEGLPLDFIERAPFNHLMPSHDWQTG